MEETREEGCCDYVREGEVGRGMATKNQTVTNKIGLFICFALVSFLCFGLKRNKEREKRTVGLI